MEKTYIAYAIHHCEQGCGCSFTRYSNVYDATGNKEKEFKTYKEAEIAARKRMMETDANDWNVI